MEHTVEPPRVHRHPESGRTIYGSLILSGTTLEPTDHYASSSGEWEPCPCPGVVLQDNAAALWVRP